MGLRIGMTYDLKTDWQFGDHDPVDANAEFDSPQTVESISSALAAGGHKVVRIGNVSNLLEKIDDLGVDIVFNICEGRQGRNRESEVPVLLQMKGIPFVGADGLTLGITLDKAVAKKCFIADGIPTPRFFLAKDSNDLQKQNTIGFPLMVKTHQEGTSKGISEKSLVHDYEGLKRQVDLINTTYNQPALVEEFISGREFTVAVIGNGTPQAMPVVQVALDGKLDLKERFFMFSDVTSGNTVKYYCPADISKELTSQLQELAVRAYHSVDCRDVGRVDFRVDENGRPYVLEINPLPSLAHNDVFNLFPRVLGVTYEQTINRIVDCACERYGLLNGSKVNWSPALHPGQEAFVL